MNNVGLKTEDEEQEHAINDFRTVESDSIQEVVKEEESTNECTEDNVVEADECESVHEDNSEYNENDKKTIVPSCVLIEYTCSSACSNSCSSSGNAYRDDEVDANIDDVTYNVNSNNIDDNKYNVSDEVGCEHLRWSPQTPKSVEKLANNDDEIDDEEHEQQQSRYDNKESARRALVEEYQVQHNELETILEKRYSRCDDSCVDNIADVITTCKETPHEESNSIESCNLLNKSLLNEIPTNIVTGNQIEIYKENERNPEINEMLSNASENISIRDEIDHLASIQRKSSFTQLYDEPTILVNLMEFCSFRTFGNLLHVSKGSYNVFTCDEVWKELLSIMRLNALLAAHNVISDYFTFFVHQVLTTSAIYGYYEYDATRQDSKSNKYSNNYDNDHSSGSKSRLNDNNNSKNNSSKVNNNDELLWEKESDSDNVNNSKEEFCKYKDCYSIGRSNSCPSEQIKSINLRISAALLGQAWHEVGRVQMLIKFFDGNAELLQGSCGFSLYHRFFFFACSSFGATTSGPHFDVHVINVMNCNKANTTICSTANTSRINEKIKTLEYVKKCGVNDRDDDDDDNDDEEKNDCDNKNNSCSQLYLKFTPRWPEPSLADKSQLPATTPLMVQRCKVTYQPIFVKPRPLPLCEEDELNSITSRTANRSDIIHTT